MVQAMKQQVIRLLTEDIWYNEHKSAHLKSSLRNFICAEKKHENYGIMSTKVLILKVPNGTLYVLKSCTNNIIN